jgi:hypothetical protein
MPWNWPPHWAQPRRGRARGDALRHHLRMHTNSVSRARPLERSEHEDGGPLGLPRAASRRAVAPRRGPSLTQQVLEGAPVLSI